MGSRAARSSPPPSSAREDQPWRNGRRNRHGSRGRWSGSTWTSRISTTPMTSSSTPPTATTSSSAAPATAGSPAHASARPSARFAYGTTAIEALDVFTTKVPNAPVSVFVHGGAWRAGLAVNYAYAPEMFVNAGAHHVVLDFNNVLETGGDLMVMADQVRRAVAWVYRNAKSFGGDGERLYVCGHSSGGHLAGVLLTTDWEKDFGLPSTVIKGGVCGSGMYDLKPVRLSKRSSYVKFTDAVEEKLSPQRHLDRLVAPVALVHGTLETPEFQRQSRDFAAAVKAAGKPVTLAVMESYNHFEVMEQLGNPYSLFGRAVLEQMRLVPR